MKVQKLYLNCNLSIYFLKTFTFFTERVTRKQNQQTYENNRPRIRAVNSNETLVLNLTAKSRLLKWIGFIRASRAIFQNCKLHAWAMVSPNMILLQFSSLVSALVHTCTVNYPWGGVSPWFYIPHFQFFLIVLFWHYGNPLKNLNMQSSTTENLHHAKRSVNSHPPSVPSGGRKNPGNPALELG